MKKFLPKESWPQIYIWSYIFVLLIAVSVSSRYAIPMTTNITIYNVIIPSFVSTVLIYIVYKYSDN